MKLAFVTTYNAQNISNWSGTPYFMARAFINAGIEVEFIGELESLHEYSFFSRVKESVFNRRLKGKLGQFIQDYEPGYLRHYARQVSEKLKNSDADIVFSPGAIPIAYLDTDKPVVMWSDATFAVMHNYYDGFTNFSLPTIFSCHRYERNVVKRLSLAIFSSAWAAESAIKYYGAKREKTKVVPYGANIRSDKSREAIVEFNKKKSAAVLKLLFVGREWVRKGGPVAVRIAIELNNMNIKTELAIVGCNPPESASFPDFIRVHGFIDKSKKEGNDLIDSLYSESHFFVLPTVADCTPIVFSEANSYGLPVITTNTGGIPSIIRNDINGKMFDLNADPAEYARYIKDHFTDFEKYSQFSERSFDEYAEVLNWNASINKIIKYLTNILNN